MKKSIRRCEMAIKTVGRRHEMAIKTIVRRYEMSIKTVVRRQEMAIKTVVRRHEMATKTVVRRNTMDTMMKLKELAKLYSGDRKTKVAAGFWADNQLIFGVNHLEVEIPEEDIVNRTKLFYDSITHAEIDLANKVPGKLVGATVYVTLFPCDNCAKRLISEGVKHIIAAEDRPTADYIIRAKQLLDEAGVTYTILG